MAPRDPLAEIHTDPVEGPLLVKSASTAAGRARLRTEAELVGRLAGAGIPALVDLVDDDDRTVLRLRWEGAHTLATIGLLPPADIAAVMVPLCDTVARLHAAGVVHGRLTADHVIIGPTGPVLCGLGDAPAGAAPSDDVAALGHLLTDMTAGTRHDALVPDRHRSRDGRPGWLRAGLLTIGDYASLDDAGARPTARALTESLRTLAVPTRAGNSAIGRAGVRWRQLTHRVGTGDGRVCPEQTASAPSHGVRHHEEPRSDLPDTPARSTLPATAPEPGPGGHLRDAEPSMGPPARSDAIPEPTAPGSEPGRAPGAGGRTLTRSGAMPVRRATEPQTSKAMAAPRVGVWTRSRDRALRPAVAGAVVGLAVALWLVRSGLAGIGGAETPSAAAHPHQPPRPPITAAPAARPPRRRATARCPAVIAPRADVDGDGCPEAVRVSGNRVRVGGRVFAVGTSGDAVAVGDWDCDGRATPALLRRSTGEVFAFDSWASTGRSVAVRPVATLGGATALDAGPDGTDGCPELRVVDRTGHVSVVAVAHSR